MRACTCINHVFWGQIRAESDNDDANNMYGNDSPLPRGSDVFDSRLYTFMLCRLGKGHLLLGA